jgi:pyruvate,water dikinase
VLEKARGYKNPREFLISTLAHGIGMIAAAFYPKPVFMRFSDFTTNEYVNLLGGKHYEPKEGMRGNH